MGEDETGVRYRAIAPTLGEMDIELSFSTTRMSVPITPAWFSPSYARPPVSAPSPTTAITRFLSPRRSRAHAKPSAAEMEVELVPSSGDTSRVGLHVDRAAGQLYVVYFPESEKAGESIVLRVKTAESSGKGAHGS